MDQFTLRKQLVNLTIEASAWSLSDAKCRNMSHEGGFLPYLKEIISMKVNGANAVTAFFPFLGNVK